MPLLGAGRNVSPRMQAKIDAWLLDNGWAQGGGSPGTGAMSEDFDSSLTLPTGFTTSGDQNWFVQGTTFYSSPNSAESGDIGNAQQTSLFLVRDGITAGMTLAFKYKTLTENVFDRLYLYINGTQITFWDGDSLGFQDYSTSLFVGLNTIEWRYTTDGSVTPNPDGCWIDNIVIS